jgi:NTE family protein
MQVGDSTLYQCDHCPHGQRTGKIKLFENEAVSPDVVLASACLPHLFHAVEIDGEHYLDAGSTTGAIRPSFQVNPLERTDLPITASQILNRINEISFNSSLLRELRAIAFVTKLIDAYVLDEKQFHRMLVHSIRADEQMMRFGMSKLTPNWDFLIFSVVYATPQLDNRHSRDIPLNAV